VIATATVEAWSGPLPPPTILSAFDDIINDGAERVFRQFELEGAHRRQLESRATKWQAFDLVVGKVFAFAFVLSALAVSDALHLGHPAAGALLGSSTLALVVGAFIYQRKK
jgi:uncharacterized membrane protein